MEINSSEKSAKDLHHETKDIYRNCMTQIEDDARNNRCPYIASFHSNYSQRESEAIIFVKPVGGMETDDFQKGEIIIGAKYIAMIKNDGLRGIEATPELQKIIDHLSDLQIKKEEIIKGTGQIVIPNNDSILIRNPETGKDINFKFLPKTPDKESLKQAIIESKRSIKAKEETNARVQERRKAEEQLQEAKGHSAIINEVLSNPLPPKGALDFSHPA